MSDEARTLTIDFRYTDVWRELWLVEQAVKIAVDAAESLAERAEAQVFAELRAKGWDDDPGERATAWQEAQDFREEVIPRFVIAPLLVPIWAAYQSGVNLMAAQLAREKGVSKPFTPRPGASFLSQAKKYLQRWFKLALDEDGPRLGRLADLARMRNSLAHGNGLRVGLRDPDWRELQEAAVRRGNHIDVERELLVVTPAYLAEACGDVRGSLAELIARAKAT